MIYPIIPSATDEKQLVALIGSDMEPSGSYLKETVKNCFTLVNTRNYKFESIRCPRCADKLQQLTPGNNSRWFCRNCRKK